MFDNIHTPKDDSDRIELQQRKRQEFHLVKKEKRTRGHILYSFNKITKEIKVADMKVCDTIDFATQEPIYQPKVVIEKDCVYLQAMNKANLIKRLKRDGLL